MNPVSSSHIAAIGHDPTTDTLTVHFRDGARYAYHGVPASLHDAILTATSAGQHFARHVKGKYPHTKL